MPRKPLLALAAAVALIAAVSIIVSPNPIVASAEVPPAPPLPDSPPSTAYVLAGAVEASALTEFEEELTEQALTRTTTASITTTTVAGVEAIVQSADSSPKQRKRLPSTTTSTTVSTTTTTSMTTTTVTTTPEEPAGGSINYAAESEFLGYINSTRSSQGMSGLTRDGSLDGRAREWSKYMAESGSLAHSDLGPLVSTWTAVAENLGKGASVIQVADLLAGSPGHLSNMVGDFTHVGVGVWQDSDGVLWTTHVFAR